MAEKGWSVFRLWLELTKLVLQRRGGYEISVLLEGLPGEVSDVLEQHTFEFVHLDWVGGEDRFAVLSAEAGCDG